MKMFFVVVKIVAGILSVIGVLAVMAAFVFGPRISKDIKKKKNYANTYAIQNVWNGKDIRVLDAGNEDGTEIIMYDHHNWECITWQLIGLGDNTFLLKNLYTQKGFEPVSDPESKVALWQQTLGGSERQHWEFIPLSDGIYLIRLKNTGLYLTATSDENNSSIVLMPEQNSKKQQWRLIRQNPIV